MLTLVGLLFVLITFPWSWIHGLFVRSGQITASQEAREIAASKRWKNTTAGGLDSGSLSRQPSCVQ